MKETLIVSNHPQTLALTLHVLRLIKKEDVVVLTVPFIAGVLHFLTRDDTSALALRERTHKNSLAKHTIANLIEAILMQTDRHVTVPENPIQLAAKKMALEERNVLIFPAGVVHTDLSTPERWKSGVGRIVQEAYKLNPNINVAMMRIFGVTKSELSEPIRVADLDIFPSVEEDLFASSRRIAQNLAQKYHDYFNVGDASID